MRFSSAGERLWVQRYDGSGDSSGDCPWAVAMDDSGAVYVTGKSEEADGTRPATTIKYRADGSVAWVARVASSSQRWYQGLGINIEPDGVRIAGCCSDSWMVAKINPAGSTMWLRTAWSGPPPGMSRSATFDPQHRAHICGSRFDTTDFSYQRMAATLDSLGNLLWQRSIPSSSPYNDAAELSGGLLFVTSRPPTTSPFEGRVIAYDSMGMVKWGDSSDIRPYGAAAGPGGRVAIAGTRHSEFTALVYSPRLGAEESPSKAPPQGRPIVEASPNPFLTRTRLMVQQADTTLAVLRIYAPSGRLVRTLQTPSRSAGRVELSWDGRDETGEPTQAGVYFVKLASLASARSRAAAPARPLKVIRMK